jgi:hypothetical protein
MTMDFERRRLWAKITMALAVLIVLVSIPIAAAKETVYESRCVGDWTGDCPYRIGAPVDRPAPIASLGLVTAPIGFLLGAAGFVAYIYYDLKVKTSRHGLY